MVPDRKAFSKAARVALSETMCMESGDAVLTIFDTKGLSFNFYDDGGVDSLDMLDIAFSIDKQLNIRLGLESLMHENKQMTLENLYDSIRP